MLYGAYIDPIRLALTYCCHSLRAILMKARLD